MQKQEYLYKGPNHAANLNDMRLKDKWCDVTIKVGGKEIRAHKVILAANLKYFETMFSSDSFQESHGGVVTMKSVEDADLELFVLYTYTGEILLTEGNVLNLLELANYLSEDGIKEACIEFAEKHLKAEEAFRAYKLANIVNSLKLKKAAKAKIVTNFEICSKDPGYLDSDHKSLSDILSDGKAQLIKSQQMLFHGIIMWIVYDTKNRKMHIENLLSCIDITKLNADDLIACLYESIADHDDEYGIIKDVMLYYHTSKIEQRNIKQVLTIVGGRDFKYCQFYNFTEKKWSSLHQISDTSENIFPYSAVLNNKLYYTSVEGNHLHVFDPMISQSRILHSSSAILRWSAICSCSRFLYLCGGLNKDKLRSDQVLRYDPLENSFETLTPMKTKKSYAAAIFYQGCLYVMGGEDANTDKSVEKYDPETKVWTTLAPMNNRRNLFNIAALEGKIYACGNFNISNDVEVYDPANDSWQPVASTIINRCFSVVVAYEGKLLAIGGKHGKTVEVYDPSKDQWQIDVELSSGLQMGRLIGGLISSSCVPGAK